MMAETKGELMVRLRISTTDIPQVERPPVNLVLAIDTSGSMKGEAIDSARAAAAGVVGALADGDRLAVVSFHSKGDVVFPSTAITAATRDSMLDAIRRIEARGTTNLAAGMSLAIAEVSRHRTADGVNRAILLSDGIPNNPASIPQMIAQAKASAIPVTALGFGLDYDESLLTRVATGTGGRFLFVEEPESVVGAFLDEVLRLEKIVARNMGLLLTPGPGLQIVEVFGSELGFAGRTGSVALGDHSLGEVRDVIVKMSGRARRDGSNVEVLDAVLSFDNAVGATARFERTAFVSVESTSDVARHSAARNRDVELSAARADAAATTIKAIAMARSGQLDPARALLKLAEKRARKAAKDFGGDAELAALADSMIELNKALPTFVGQVLEQPGLDPSGRPRPRALPEPGSEDPAAPQTVRRSHSEATKTLQGR